MFLSIKNKRHISSHIGAYLTPVYYKSEDLLTVFLQYVNTQAIRCSVPRESFGIGSIFCFGLHLRLMIPPTTCVP